MGKGKGLSEKALKRKRKRKSSNILKKEPQGRGKVTSGINLTHG